MPALTPPDRIASDKLPYPDRNFMEALYNRYMEFRNKPGNLYISDLVKLVYEITDEMMSVISQAAVCKKGCHYCCDVSVAVSAMEATYISTRTGIAANMSNETILSNETIYPWCPFLKDGECSIYKYRPVACRTFVTFDDPIYCEFDVPHNTFAIAVPGENKGSEFLNWVYADAVQISLQHPMMRACKDIRQYFDLPIGTIK